MSDETSRVFLFKGDDPDMLLANDRARATFRYFWRELFWEYNRIIPALSMAAIKVAFHDPDVTANPDVEHMWVNDINFDGETISGTLLNEPTWLRNVQQGETVDLGIDQVGDWLLVGGDRVCGAFTVQLMRARMDADERRRHDEAWDLDFGDPTDILLTPWDGTNGRPTDPDAEHPMGVNMLQPYTGQLKADAAGILGYRDDVGNSLLHLHALAGNLRCVELFLEHGADPALRNGYDQTPRDLAQLMGWTRIVARLS